MEIVELANEQIRVIILNALNCLTQMSAAKNEQLIPYCSLSTTKTDLLQYQTSRLFDIQYSFSLQQPWLTKKNPQPSPTIAVQHFVDGFVENLIQSALTQMKAEEPMQVIHSYADQLAQSTIRKATETVQTFQIEEFSSRLAEDVLCDALSTIVDDELYSKWRWTDNDDDDQSITFEEEQIHPSNNHEQSIDSLVDNLAQRIYRCSFDHLREMFTIDK